MPIPVHLLRSVARLRQTGARAALVVRHAERHPVIDLRNHEEVLLTERGHVQAEKCGTLLAPLAARLRVLHSPVERCAQTARGIVAGARGAGSDAEVVCAVEELASPFVKDKTRAWDLVTATGPGFIREWFDGRMPPDVFEPRAQAARGQLDVVSRWLTQHTEREPDTLVVFVSHDWNIAIVREELLGVTPETVWPGYLDGVVVSVDERDIVVELDGRVGRRPRG